MIAVQLGKTLKSIQKKMNYLDLIKRKRGQDWTKKEMEYLTKHYTKAKMSLLKAKLNRESNLIRVKACEMGLSRDVSTYIETEVEEILKEHCLHYRTQVNVRGFVVDFVVGANKAIEVHGDFWHCNPEVYPASFAKAQIKNVQRDKVKYCVMKEEGYEVLIIWEKDLNDNYEKCVQKILGFAVPS